MRKLNDIVSRNAEAFIAHAKKRALEDEGRELSDQAIAGRMANAMDIKQDTARQALARARRGKGPWTADYIQGLAIALGKTPQDFLSLDSSGGSVSEATVAQALYTGLNHRLTPKQARDWITRLHRLLDHAPLMTMTQKLVDALLDAEDKGAAYESAHALIQRSDAFNGKRPELRGKRIRTNKPK